MDPSEYILMYIVAIIIKEEKVIRLRGRGEMGGVGRGESKVEIM